MGEDQEKKKQPKTTLIKHRKKTGPATTVPHQAAVIPARQSDHELKLDAGKRQCPLPQSGDVGSTLPGARDAADHSDRSQWYHSPPQKSSVAKFQ